MAARSGSRNPTFELSSRRRRVVNSMSEGIGPAQAEGDLDQQAGRGVGVPERLTSMRNRVRRWRPVPHNRERCRTAGGSPVPVARPPDRPEAAADARRSRAARWSGTGGLPRPSRAGPARSRCTSSCCVILACWYFSPPLNKVVTFDSRLAGSPNGVAEGEMFTGGLNTPLPMPAAPLADNELAADSPSPGSARARSARARSQVSGCQEPQRRGRQAQR